jgi:hypothetical protein
MLNGLVTFGKKKPYFNKLKNKRLITLLSHTFTISLLLPRLKD